MFQQTAQSHPISDIIRVMNSGMTFYQYAKEQMDDHQYEGFFNRMIDAKAKAIYELQSYAIEETGRLETRSDGLTKARQVYTKLEDMILPNSSPFTYVAQLEEVEDKVLKEVDEALEQDISEDCEATLQRIKVRMKECHEEMKALKKGTVN